MKTILSILVASVLLFSCTLDSGISPADNFSNPASLGGSIASFTIQDNYLYTIDRSSLSTYDISDESEIIFVHKLELEVAQLETIFPYGNELYLGSTTGVLIIDISTPSTPRFLSEFQHVLACDPVVTNGEFAYVTLRSGNTCGQTQNELQVLDLANILDPQLVTTYSMSNPRGLALNGGILYVCDDGIKVLDISNHENITLLNHISGIPANDVLFYQNQILVTAENGFYQYNVTNGTEFSLLGHFVY